MYWGFDRTLLAWIRVVDTWRSYRCRSVRTDQTLCSYAPTVDVHLLMLLCVTGSTHTYRHTRNHSHAHVHTNTFTCSHSHENIHTYTSTCTHSHTHTHTFTRTLAHSWHCHLNSLSWHSSFRSLISLALPLSCTLTRPAIFLMPCDFQTEEWIEWGCLCVTEGSCCRATGSTLSCWNDQIL